MRRRIAIVTALLALVSAAPAAASGGSLDLRKVDTSAFPTVKLTVQTQTPGKAPDLRVLENGVPARNLSPIDPGAPAAIALVIDTSNSMAGAKMDDAISAARGFVGAQKDGNLLGVYGFDSTAYPAARLSPDRTEVDTALSQLGTGGGSGTALFGAVKLASEDLRTAPAQRRVLILLTDGSSQDDTATITQAISAAQQASVIVYPIGIATEGGAQAALERIASSTGGTAATATDSSALAGVYDTISTELGTTYTYLYQSAAAPGAPIKLDISAPGMGSVSQSLKAPGTYVAPSTGSGGLELPSNAAGRGLMAGIVGLFVLLSMVFVLSSRPDVVVHKRIAPYTDSKKRAKAELDDGEPAKIPMLTQLFISTERIVGSMNFWRRMSSVLEQADLPLRTAELFYIQMGCALLFGVISAACCTSAASSP